MTSEKIQQILPLTYLLFTRRGRLARIDFLCATIFIWCTFYILYSLLDHSIGKSSTWVLYPLFYWCSFATISKRLHDTQQSIWRFFIVAVFAGPAAGAVEDVLGTCGASWGRARASSASFFGDTDQKVMPCTTQRRDRWMNGMLGAREAP